MFYWLSAKLSFFLAVLANPIPNPNPNPNFH